MAITYNNLQSVINTTTLPSYTPTVLTDSCLVVIVTSEDVGNNDPITSIVFDGAPMVEGVISHHVKGSNAQDVAIFYLLSPSTSSGDIVVSGSERQSVIALTLDNVDQTSAIDDTGTTGANGGVSLAVSATTTNANSFAVSGVVGDSDLNVLTLTTATKIISLIPASTASAVAVSTQSSAGLFTHDWISSIALNRAASAVVAFNEATAGSGITLTAGEQGPSFTGAINASVEGVTISVNISEVGPSFSDAVNVTLDKNITADIISVGPSFTDNINITLTKGIAEVITGVGPSFSDNVSVIIPIKFTVNPKNLIQVKRKVNTVTINKQNTTIRAVRTTRIIRVK